MRNPAHLVLSGDQRRTVAARCWLNIISLDLFSVVLLGRHVFTLLDFPGQNRFPRQLNGHDLRVFTVNNMSEKLLAAWPQNTRVSAPLQFTFLNSICHHWLTGTDPVQRSRERTQMINPVQSAAALLSHHLPPIGRWRSRTYPSIRLVQLPFIWRFKGFNAGLNAAEVTIVPNGANTTHTKKGIGSTLPPSSGRSGKYILAPWDCVAKLFWGIKLYLKYFYDGTVMIVQKTYVVIQFQAKASIW